MKYACIVDSNPFRCRIIYIAIESLPLESLYCFGSGTTSYKEHSVSAWWRVNVRIK